MSGKQHPGGEEPSPQPIDVDLAELRAIVERAKSSLPAEEHAKLTAAIHTLVFLTEELRAERTSIARLRALLFGVTSEKTRHVLGELVAAAARPGKAPQGTRPKPPGHGRNGATAYAGAEKVPVPHPAVRAGEPCPHCGKGRIRCLPQPVRLVRFQGMAPLSATVYEKEHLRCALCGEVFTAPSPEGVGEAKYDETATAMTAQLKYGTGLPFNRIEKLHAGMGIPLPASTQWEIVRDGAALLAPAHEELLRQAAQGDVLYNDDTSAKILDLTQQRRAAAADADAPADERTGVFTSGIVATRDGRRIAIFCTGAQHAGENLADVLQQRQANLPPPIQMCDGLASNTSEDFAAILAHCIVHARRKYVEVAESFPQECSHVLALLGQVYGHDAEARRQGLTPAQRLALHQEQSGPVMDQLQQWMAQQIDERRVEPNSGLGKAIGYMQRRWDAL
ncbi:MAG TPA: transposase, partial [Thermoanaerobaculia bacterium]|nr:transposase [Thermoanaerobaculia bacterium]